MTSADRVGGEWGPGRLPSFLGKGVPPLAVEPIELVSGLSPDEEDELRFLLNIVEKYDARIHELAGRGFRRILNVAECVPPGSS